MSRFESPRSRSRHSFGTSRRLRFEPLEDRRLLSISSDTFVQVTRTVSQEAMVLTVDENGQFQVYYHPNDELGYVDPATGDLLFADYFAGLSNVLVLNAVPNGNLSDLTGVNYSNGQIITPDGGVTVYHRDGSIMRSGSTWTYDAGASLRSSENYFWSNGVLMKSGSTFRHPNGINLQSGNTLLYASGNTFKANSFTLFYPGTEPLRNTSYDYFYADGTSLESGNTLYYSSGAVMADASGNVFNDNGTPTFKPYSRYQFVGDAEVVTRVDQRGAEVIVAIQNISSDSFAAHVTRIKIDYQIAPPDPTDLKVTYVDPTTLLFQWQSGGGTTAGYRVAWNTGVSAPGDVSTGIDTTNNYYVVSGLTPGQKVSLRVAAKDAEGDLSYGASATGTAGEIAQTKQTGELVASALETTFAQAYDGIDRNIVLTVDEEGNSIVWYFVNDELGYVNIDNGDILRSADAYEVPGSEIRVTQVIEMKPVANIAQIPSGAHYSEYSGGQLVRNGDTYYYDDGAVLRDSGGTWYYRNGNVLRNSTTTFWPGGITMRSGTTFRYANNSLLKSGTTLFYPSGTTFHTPTTANYGNGSTLRNAAGNLFYETGAALTVGSSFHYANGTQMINGAGDAFYANGAPASFPFEYSEFFTNSSTYVGEAADRIARYAVAVVGGTTSVQVFGGSVDYSVVPPPAPQSLQVVSVTSNSITFQLASGGGTTQDFVYAYTLGSTAPYTPEGGTIISGNSFTITGLNADQQISVRLFARNSEGEFSPGITATATTAAATLAGDHNVDGTVNAADYVLWRKNPAAFGNGAGYNAWHSHFGETAGGGGAAERLEVAQSQGDVGGSLAGEAELTVGEPTLNFALLVPDLKAWSAANKNVWATRVVPAGGHSAALLALLSATDAERESSSWDESVLNDLDEPREQAFEDFGRLSVLEYAGEQ